METFAKMNGWWKNSIKKRRFKKRISNDYLGIRKDNEKSTEIS